MRHQPRRPIGPVTGIVVMMAILIVMQMWLLTATLEAFLAGDVGAAVPGAVISGLVFLAVGALYVFLVKLDARQRRD